MWLSCRLVCDGNGLAQPAALLDQLMGFAVVAVALRLLAVFQLLCSPTPRLADITQVGF